ncbi:helix-turn-helix transcriptional regulator [Kribbella sp. NPDC051770]|uniref:helix-turn-helix transcriptional regulator n=1 Tax=Kribbella sp. NPDC051770 TaxID=3155413 RepID=UPI00343DA35E
MDRSVLADFLRSRREALQPEDVGLPRAHRRRRAAGLRREEVAALAGMSTDYYSRIEQQRGPHPSEQLLAAIATGLRLTQPERDHLYRIAGYAAPLEVADHGRLSPGVRRVFEQLDGSPAEVVNHLTEKIVQNRLSSILFGDQTRYAGLRRAMAYRWFTDPCAERGPFPVEDHARHSRTIVAHLLLAHTQNRSEPRLAALIGSLLHTSAEFTELWHEHPVTEDDPAPLLVRHAEVGDVHLYRETLHSPDRTQHLIVYTTEPGSESEEKLRFLSVLRYELI